MAIGIIPNRTKNQTTSTKTVKANSIIPDRTVKQPVLNKGGIDVSNNVFNPLNQNSQFVDPKGTRQSAFPQVNPITEALKPKNWFPAVKDTFKKNLPGTTETINKIKSDPLNKQAIGPFKEDYKNIKPSYAPAIFQLSAAKNAWNAIKDSVIAEKENIKNVFKDKGRDSIASQTSNTAKALITGPANIFFSPLTALFEGAKTLPVLGTVTEAISVPFMAVGEAGSGTANAIINKLPISEKHKEELKPGIEEIFALAGQILLGKAGEVGYKKLRTKYGPEGANTIIEQANKLANEKLAKEFPQANPIPVEVQPKVVSKTVLEAPKLTKKAIETPKPVKPKSEDILISEALKYKSAEEFVRAQQPRVGGIAPELKGETLYRGMSESEWKAIQDGGLSGKRGDGRTYLTTEKETAQMAVDEGVKSGKGEGVIVELKPEAGQKVISGGKIGENTGGNLRGEYQGKDIGIDDIARVTDSKGNVIYEASTGGKTKSQLVDIYNKAHEANNVVNTKAIENITVYRGETGGRQTGNTIKGKSEFGEPFVSFSDNAKLANRFGDKVNKFEINPNKYLDVSKITDKKAADILKSKDGVIEIDPNKTQIKQLKALGYDGIKFKNVENTGQKGLEFRHFGDLKKEIIKTPAEIAKQALALTKANGGVTIRLNGDVPVKGYAVAPSKKTEAIIPKTKKGVEDYITSHWKELQAENAHFGGWINEKGQFIADVSHVVKSPAEAAKLAKAGNQDAFINLENFKETKKGQYEKIISANEAKQRGNSPTVHSKSTPTNKEQTVQEAKVSKVASDANKNLVEKGFKGLSEEQLAKYDPITKKETIEKVSKFMDNIEQAKEAIKTGEAPGNFKPADKQVLFNAMEEYAMKNNDIQLLRDLANSPIATELSVAAQTLGASGFNKNPESVVAKIKEVNDIRRETAAKKLKVDNIDTVIKKEAAKIKTQPATKMDWASFVKEIKCN